VFFLNDNATKIMGLTGEGVSSVVWVSCAATLQDIMAGSGRGIFAPDAKSKNLSGAKYYLPGFCIKLRRDHYFTTVGGARHMEPAGAYQLPSPVSLARRCRPPNSIPRVTDDCGRLF
jgi:hypothetical protein